MNERIISSNLDAPEGGMDGLLQAVVCQDVSHIVQASTDCMQNCIHTHYA